jgi:hypothetical protein
VCNNSAYFRHFLFRVKREKKANDRANDFGSYLPFRLLNLMEVKEPYSSKIAPAASPASQALQAFPEVSRISAVFDEYIKRDWAEELGLI